MNSRQSSANAADEQLITDHCPLVTPAPRPPITDHRSLITASRLRLTLALALLLLPRPDHGQDIEPRRWSHVPIGDNFGSVAYAYSFGDIYLLPALQIQNASFDLQTVGVKYIRSFALFGKSARVEVTQPFQTGHWSGLLNGVPGTVDRSGLADTSLRFAVNLYGAPPLAGKEFAAYRATEADHETIVGLGLVAQLPTGQYYDDKLINLGNHRFALRPQLGAIHNFSDHWSAELTAQSWVFTENDRFYHQSRLDQAPLFTTDASLVYSFRPGLWLAASAGYGVGGTTTVNGRSNDDSQSNAGWGLSLGIPINRALGVRLSYAGTRTLTNTGLDSDTVSCALSVMW